MLALPSDGTRLSMTPALSQRVELLGTKSSVSPKQFQQARQHAEKALALLDSHALPTSSWTETEPYRGEIRRGAQQVLNDLSAAR